jgi:hypothetical protein
MSIVVFILYLVVLSYFSENLLPALVIGGFGALGAATVVSSLQRKGAIERLNMWPRVCGEVLKCGIDRDRYSDSYVGGSKKTKIASYDWVPEVHYSYEVKGTCYQSHNLFSTAAGNTAYKKSKVKEILSAYKVGGDIYVYYNPDAPEEGYVLHPDNKNNLLFGLILSFMCAYLVLNNGIT